MIGIYKCLNWQVCIGPCLAIRIKGCRQRLPLESLELLLKTLIKLNLRKSGFWFEKNPVDAILRYYLVEASQHDHNAAILDVSGHKLHSMPASNHVWPRFSACGGVVEQKASLSDIQFHMKLLHYNSRDQITVHHNGE